MTDDIQTLISVFPHAAAAGMIIAAVCSMLGVFVILKRIVFIGIALSHTAALGVAAAILFHLKPLFGAAAVTLFALAVLVYPIERHRLPREALLGVIFVFAASLSVLLMSGSGHGLHEIHGMLYGDLILAGPDDFQLILATLLPIAAYLLAFMRPTLCTFVDREAAQVMGIRVALWELLYFFALGVAVSAASKTAGTLLVFCFLVVTPSTALLLSRRLWMVIILAVTLAVAATLIGMLWSISRDLPTNQSVSTTACIIFAAALIVAAGRNSINLRCRRQKLHNTW